MRGVYGACISFVARAHNYFTSRVHKKFLANAVCDTICCLPVVSWLLPTLLIRGSKEARYAKKNMSGKSGCCRYAGIEFLQRR